MHSYVMLLLYEVAHAAAFCCYVVMLLLLFAYVSLIVCIPGGWPLGGGYCSTYALCLAICTTCRPLSGLAGPRLGRDL